MTVNKKCGTQTANKKQGENEKAQIIRVALNRLCHCPEAIKKLSTGTQPTTSEATCTSPLDVEDQPDRYAGEQEFKAPTGD